MNFSEIFLLLSSEFNVSKRTRSVTLAVAHLVTKVVTFLLAKGHHHVQSRLLVDHILSQMNPTHILFLINIP
jgi:hypothetical protein